MAMLVDKSTLTVAALYDAIQWGKGGRQRGPGKTLLFDISCGLAHRVPLTKQVEQDGDVCKYLFVLMVAALAWAGEVLVTPEGMQITIMTREAFKMLLKEVSYNCDDYGLVNW